MGKALKKLRKDLRKLAEGFLDDVDDFCCIIFKKRRKIHKRMKKGMGKQGKPAYSASERIRGFLYVIIGASLVLTAIIASRYGVTGIGDLLNLLINTWWGRLLILLIGAANLMYGLYKLIMGAD